MATVPAPAGLVWTLGELLASLLSSPPPLLPHLVHPVRWRGVGREKGEGGGGGGRGRGREGEGEGGEGEREGEEEGERKEEGEREGRGRGGGNKWRRGELPLNLLVSIPPATFSRGESQLDRTHSPWQPR